MDDVNQLPAAFKVVKVTEQADKAAIKAALKDGVDVTGCRIETHRNLQIK